MGEWFQFLWGVFIGDNESGPIIAFTLLLGTILEVSFGGLLVYFFPKFNVRGFWFFLFVIAIVVLLVALLIQEAYRRDYKKKNPSGQTARIEDLEGMAIDREIVQRLLKFQPDVFSFYPQPVIEISNDKLVFKILYTCRHSYTVQIEKMKFDLHAKGSSHPLARDMVFSNSDGTLSDEGSASSGDRTLKVLLEESLVGYTGKEMDVEFKKVSIGLSIEDKLTFDEQKTKNISIRNLKFDVQITIPNSSTA